MHTMGHVEEIAMGDKNTLYARNVSISSSASSDDNTSRYSQTIHMPQSGLQSQSAFFNRGDIDGDGAGARCT